MRSQARKLTISVSHNLRRDRRFDDARKFEDRAALNFFVHIPGSNLSLHDGGNEPGHQPIRPRPSMWPSFRSTSCFQMERRRMPARKWRMCWAHPIFNPQRIRAALRNSEMPYSAQNSGCTFPQRVRTGTRCWIRRPQCFPRKSFRFRRDRWFRQLAAFLIDYFP